MTVQVNYTEVRCMGVSGYWRTVWIPYELDKLVEETRRKFGMNRSSFYKYALVRLLEELEVLSSKTRQ